MPLNANSGAWGYRVNGLQVEKPFNHGEDYGNPYGNE